MGLLDRLRGGRGESSRHVEAEATTRPVCLLDGHDDLEVVGESWHQDVLWRLSGGTVGDRIRYDIVAVLVPEPTNPHDANAISVQIDGHLIGYLSRATAQEYLPGLKQLMSVHASHIGLRGVIVGGGYYDDGPGRLGVCDLPRGFRTDHPLGWASGKVTYFAPSEEELLAGIQG